MNRLQLAVVTVLFAAWWGAGCETSIIHTIEIREVATDLSCAPSAVVNSLEAQSSGDGVQLTWTVTEADADGFLIERRSHLTAGWGEIADVPAIYQLDAAAAPLNFSYLEAWAQRDVQYEYRIRAYRLEKDEQCVTVASDIVPVLSLPRAPVLTGITVAAFNVLLVTWSDTNDFETHYRIERSIGDMGFAVVSTAERNSTRYEDANLILATRYVYRVVAVNGSGEAVSETTVSERTANPPVLSWQGAAQLDDACVLSVSGLASFDDEKQVIYASAEATSARCSDPPVANEEGLQCTLDDHTPGAFGVSWSVTDGLGGSTTQRGSLELTAPTVMRTWARAPSLALGDDAMPGHQAILGGCKTCTGSRGMVAAGPTAACALDDTGALQCWGEREVLASGFIDNALNPTGVCADTVCAQTLAAVAVSVGIDHACALTSIGGGVKCWGTGFYEQLGDGGDMSSATPTQVCTSGSVGGGDCVELSGVAEIYAGHDHTCALLQDGTAYCWGHNGSGRLGNGTTDDTMVATPVCATGSVSTADCVALTDIAQIAPGYNHTCAVLNAGGEVLCWGNNYYGQMGLGAYDSGDHPNPTPVCPTGVWNGSECNDGAPVLAMGDVAELVAGYRFACARLTSGAAKCWGDGGSGGLGYGGTSEQDSPVDVCATGTGATCDPLTGIVSLTAGEAHVCAILDDSASGGTTKAACWGRNYDGQLGDGTTSSVSNPVQVCISGTAGVDCDPVVGIAEIAAGEASTCAISASGGAVSCWGANDDARLGSGVDRLTLDESAHPLVVCTTSSGAACPGFAGATGVSIGEAMACGISAQGEVVCWGGESARQLGQGAADTPVPSRVCMSGARGSCVPMQDVTAVAFQNGAACALGGDQRVRCWGVNGESQLGNGYGSGYSVYPQEVCARGLGGPAGCYDGTEHTPLEGIVSLATSGFTACALTDAGMVLCWGNGNLGQLGDGVPSISGTWNPLYRDGASLPGPVCATGALDNCVPLDKVRSIAMGGSHACAVSASGEASCWGMNHHGQLGDGTVLPLADGLHPYSLRNNPVTVCTLGSGAACESLKGVEQLALGDVHSCALLDSGEVWCWGGNARGQLGNRTEIEVVTPSPVCAPGEEIPCAHLNGVAALAATYWGTCALKRDGTVWCWGDGYISRASGGNKTIPAQVCASYADEQACNDGAECTVPLTGITALSGGDTYVCGLHESKTVMCWGHEMTEELGNGAIGSALESSCMPRPVCLTGEGVDCSEGAVAGAPLDGLAMKSCALVSIEGPQ